VTPAPPAPSPKTATSCQVSLHISQVHCKMWIMHL
jgi:hypothetical protein